MSNREPYRSPEQKLSDREMLLERSQENELRLAARVAELEAAAKDLLGKPPCSDPDCCPTAREESVARDHLQAVLNRA